MRNPGNAKAATNGQDRPEWGVLNGTVFLYVGMHRTRCGLYHGASRFRTGAGAGGYSESLWPLEVPFPSGLQARATEQLKRPATTITEAAHAVGFGSSQAFAKAVKRELSMTASSIREDTDCLADVVAKLSVPSHTEPTETPQLSVEIANFEPFSAIARYTDGQYPKLNDVYWGLFDVVGAPEKVEAILGQPFDDIEGGDIEFICSLKVSTDIKKPLTGYSARRIPGGVAIMMRHRGVYEQLLDTVDHLYLSAIAIPEVQLADEPLLFHYLDDPEEVAEEDLRTDLYLFLELNERPAL